MQSQRVALVTSRLRGIVRSNLSNGSFYKTIKKRHRKAFSLPRLCQNSKEILTGMHTLCINYTCIDMLYEAKHVVRVKTCYTCQDMLYES